MNLQEQFGQIDIYLFDQILRGNIRSGMRVLDAGCGDGRNLVYLLREGFDVLAIDAKPEAVERVRQLAKKLNPRLPDENFRVASLEQMPFPDHCADLVICSAVLHFSRDEKQFRSMLAELWRVLKPGGILFARLASRIGMEFEHLRDRVFRLRDGQEWFLVDEKMLLDLTAEMGADLVDPLKTSVVQDRRCMTTWVLSKRSIAGN